MKRVRAFLMMCLLLSAFATAALAQETVIRLSFAGDTTLGGHEDWMGYSIGTFKVMAQQNDFSYFLKYCLDIFGHDDLTLVNLEGVLADSAKGRNKSLKWQFRGETAYTQILTLGSVEMVTLGNNHSGDFGPTGLASTKAALEREGIGYCVDETVGYYEKDGVKLAFLGFWADSYQNHKDRLALRVKELKENEGVDAVILNYHGGRQYWQKHRASQTEDMRYAIDCGVDLVIGHHPHVLQGIEIYKNRSIVYSLGDFCYGGNRKPREIEYPTMILGVELLFEGETYSSQQLTIHPYRISGTAPRNNYQPVPADAGQAEEVMVILQADTPFPLAPYAQGLGAVQAPVPAHD